MHRKWKSNRYRARWPLCYMCNSSLKVCGHISNYGHQLWFSQDKNIDTICHSIVDLAQLHCPNLIPEIMALCTKFKELFELFASCHQIYNKNYVTDEDIKNLGKYVLVWCHHSYSILCLLNRRQYPWVFIGISFLMHLSCPRCTCLRSMCFPGFRGGM